MTGKGFKLFRLFGFTVRADWSWLIIAVLVAWSLGAGVFPNQVEGLSTQTYWVMGIIGALGLFLSVIIHEFAHSLVARARGLNMKGITLFIFGGVAEMEEEPADAATEFWIAIVGPVTSFALAGLFYLALIGTGMSATSGAVAGVLAYLASINALLAMFNLVPAFPLDGGRVLRSLLWGWKGDLRWATRIAVGAGNAFGILLIAGGVFFVISGNLITGLWWFLIGQFLRNAAQMSYQQVLLRHALEGESLSRFMRADPVTVAPGISIAALVNDFMYRHHFKMYPVVDGGRLVGCISTREVKEIPREEWDVRTVGSSLHQCSVENTIRPDADPLKALSRMSRNGVSRLMVVDGDRLVGVVTLKDMLHFLSVKIDLEDDRIAKDDLGGPPVWNDEREPGTRRDRDAERDQRLGGSHPRPV